MIDASHANSGKRAENQPLVVEDVSRQVGSGDGRIVGVMVESNLVAGRQDQIFGTALIHGRSITDACIDWETSIQVMDRLAKAVEARRCQRIEYRSAREGEVGADAKLRGYE
jgi:3-deoxy-7-phosphoheptulonate synthase